VRILSEEQRAKLLLPGNAHREFYDQDMRAFMVARSRYAEDTLARAVAAGVKQYVLLGAGLDTFAYRNPFIGVRVFEVDHHSTQAWKRELLSAASIPIPEHLTFAPVDFESQSLEEGLSAARFSGTSPRSSGWGMDSPCRSSGQHHRACALPPVRSRLVRCPCTNLKSAPAPQPRAVPDGPWSTNDFHRSRRCPCPCPSVSPPRDFGGTVLVLARCVCALCDVVLTSAVGQLTALVQAGRSPCPRADGTAGCR